MRYLGLDLGTKTLGISLSDTTRTIATAYGTIRYEEGDYNFLTEKIKEIIKANSVGKIVLGFPKNMNNTVGESGERCLTFQQKLQQELDIEVVMQDERLTTVEATKYMLVADISRNKRKQKIDGLAANIILQTYLDKERGIK